MSTYLFIGLGICGIWLAVLTFVFLKYVSHYKKLIDKSRSGDLKKLLEEILVSEEKNKKEIVKILANIQKIETVSLTHLQKLGLVRYNPFNDTGGDHSFSLSALDGNGNGFVLTGLHTREKTRFYIKSVKNGHASRELSNEEKRSIELALK